MNRAYRVVAGVASLLLLCALLPPRAGADTLPVPIISFREVKITGDEFIVVQANQTITDLSSYWLGYSSSDTATNIVPSQQLPAIGLSKGQAVLFTSDSAQTCDAVYTSKLSVSLSDTKGTLQLRQLVNIDKNTSTFTTVDSVNWTKPSTSDKTPVTDSLDLRREAGITLPVWYHDASSTAAWAVGNFASCSLSVAASTGGVTSQTYAWPANSDEPPAVILNLSPDTTSSDMPTIPAADMGLLPPQITELLPNPTGTGTDATDEFIELYNPNPKPFDLSGFVLETGTSTKHSFTFSAGTSLPPNSFVAFYSADTGLSLSNTSGASDLLDPLGALLAQTNQYDTAKDGQSWSLAKGTWYWTLQSTPGKANSVVQTVSVNSSGKSLSSQKNSSAKVKGASTTVNGAPQSSATIPGNTTQVSPIHPWTLAVVAGLALAYGLYEYRLDMANVIHRLKRHRALGRAHG